MADKVTLGGDRLGSGEKIQVERHNYMMNSFNLSQDWKSSMAPGILYPCLKLIGTNHGTFDIDVDHLVRTIPTKGPLFGSFKLQVDFFNVPFRLYQGILHNNPTKIGMNMNKVYLPKIKIKTIDGTGAPIVKGSSEDTRQINESSLEKYLGLSGIGKAAAQQAPQHITRKLQCVPELAYYDIFKCYYANKQEENAYVIMPENIEILEPTNLQGYQELLDMGGNPQLVPFERNNLVMANVPDGQEYVFYFEGENFETIEEQINLKFTAYMSGNNDYNPITYWAEEEEVIQYKKINENKIKVTITGQNLKTIFNNIKAEGDTNLIITYSLNNEYEANIYTSDIKLEPFALQNIDDMRSELLAKNKIGEEFVIGESGDWDDGSGTDQTGLPYWALAAQTDQSITYNAFAQNGLVVKTYQSDIFNNWLNSETIDGLEGVKARTAVDTSGGSFTQDDLILHEKLYEVLNRIAVGDGTYQDWQEATYGEGAVRMCETPMYVGGMSAEVFFDEIISSSETNVNGDYQPLGSLGGRGKTMGQKGGTNIHCKCDEPGYVMAIVSLTPRIVQTQGNDWDRVELDTLDDLHKPGLDGIGFQDLPVEWFAWWDTVIDGSTILHRSMAGKQTAWLHYQTAVDKAFGDFAKPDGYSFMVLGRNYEHVEGHANQVKDITTYIDPAKYNYAFAVTDLAAQNFWVQLSFKIIARRKMGAQQLPNL